MASPEASPGVSPDVYKPLTDASTSFRLLHLHAGGHEEPLRADLTNFVRSQSPEYVALSYTWGLAANTKTISVDNHDFTVTPNCESALRHIRKEDGALQLWVDAICINQADPVEKGPQIGQMRDIYKSAAHVIIWLGDECETTSLAFDLLTQISEFGRYDSEMASSRTIGSPKAWRAVEILFEQEWFERIWVVQESSLAKAITIQCGHHTMSWTTFVRALQWYVEDIAVVRRSIISRDSLVMNAAEVRNAWGMRQHGVGADLTLDDLLRLFGHWKATDPRDKVNALLGISEEHAVPELQPDYTKTVRQVYGSVVRYLITRDKRLTILGQCQNPPLYKGSATSKGLPTWVPDWTPDRPYRAQLSETYRPPGDAQVMMATDGSILIPSSLSMPETGYGTWQQDSMIREEMNFKASLDMLAESHFPTAEDEPLFICDRGPQPEPEDTMMLRGIQIDTIYSVSRPLFRVKEDLDDPTFFEEWEKFAILQMPPDVECPYGGSFEDKLEAFWRTISTDRIYEVRSNLRATPVCRQLFEQWRAKMIRDARPEEAYVAETVDTIDNDNDFARARIMYNAFADLNLSHFQSGGAIQINLNDPSTVPQGTAPTVNTDIIQDYETWKQRIARLDTLTSSVPPPPAPPQQSSPRTTTTTSRPGPREEFTQANFERSLRHWCFARKLARTTSGRLALVPEHTRPGDQIFILFGGSVPYIARPLLSRVKVQGNFVDETGAHGPPGARYLVASQLHQFVGEAYVHGVMDGEAMGYPPLERTWRMRQVEIDVGRARGPPELEATTKMTVFKEVIDPLTEEQQLLVDEWREALRRRTREVWFDYATSEMLDRFAAIDEIRQPVPSGGGRP